MHRAALAPLANLVLLLEPTHSGLRIMVPMAAAAVTDWQRGDVVAPLPVGARRSPP